MFTRDVALYLQKVYPAVETVDQEERRILVLEFLIQPFTAEMAEELGILGHLFARKGGQPLDDLASIQVAISVPLQQVEFRMAPDTPEASVILRAVDVEDTIRVRKDKEGPVYAATLVTSVRYPDPDALLFLLNGYRRQHFLTFTQEQGDMLADQPPKKSKGRRRSGDPELPMAGETAV